jgi:regulator of RNase E activity RraA
VPFALGSIPTHQAENHEKIIAPAQTLKLVSKNAKPEPLPEGSESAVPKDKHWIDMTEEGTVVVIEQPDGQSCAAIGGIMARRMKVRGVSACVVGGRVRDVAELRATSLPVSHYYTRNKRY